VRQLDVFDDGLLPVPLRIDGIGSGQDGRAGIELANHAGLGNAQSLLLHDLVQDGPSSVRHLVELVDAADSVVGQYQGSTGEPIKYKQ